MTRKNMAWRAKIWPGMAREAITWHGTGPPCEKIRQSIIAEAKRLAAKAKRL